MKTHGLIAGFCTMVVVGTTPATPDVVVVETQVVEQETAQEEVAPGEDVPLDVQLGDSRADVLRMLGSPSGEGRFDNRALLSYPRGTILLEDDRVREVDLVPLAEWEAEQQRRREESLRLAKAAHDELQALLSDPYFLNASLTERMRRWETYRRAWPNFSLPPAYQRDLAEWMSREEERREQEARDRRVAELERRVARAEWEAADAKRRAEQAKWQSEQQRESSYSFGTTYYAPPVIHGSGPYFQYTPRKRQEAGYPDGKRETGSGGTVRVGPTNRSVGHAGFDTPKAGK